MTNFRNYMISEDDAMEQGIEDRCYIVFINSSKPIYYNACKGIFTDLEAAKAFARDEVRHLDDEEEVVVAKLSEWLAGDYNSIDFE